jgi:hypothetical protein
LTLAAADYIANKTAAAVQGQENVSPHPNENRNPGFHDLEAQIVAHDPVRLEGKFKRPAPDLEGGNPFDEVARDRSLQRQIILLMALQRNVGDEPDSEQPQNNTPIINTDKTVIEDGFYWREFPLCEQVLHKHMADYYGIGIGSGHAQQRQAKMQQSFNMMLVTEVREAAAAAQLTFGPNFTEKKLRDRIRCFYKTHLQNAKKRLATLQKHPNSVDNQALLRVYVRSCQTGCSFEESLLAEPVDQIPRKKGRLTQVEKALQSLTAAAAGNSSGNSNC